MANSVTAPLERQFRQMPALVNGYPRAPEEHRSSRCSSTTLSSLDIAEQEVQAAVNASGKLLPPNLPAPPIYAKSIPRHPRPSHRPNLQDDAPDAGAGSGGTKLSPKTPQLTRFGLVSLSRDHRPTITCKPICERSRLTIQHRRFTPLARQCQRQRLERQFRQAVPGLFDQCQ